MAKKKKSDQNADELAQANKDAAKSESIGADKLLEAPADPLANHPKFAKFKQ